MEGLNAREPISGLKLDCQLTFLIYGTCRKAYISREIEPPSVIIIPLVTDSVLPIVHVVSVVEPHVPAAVSRTGGSQ